MKKQIANRLGVAHVRDTVKSFSEGSISLAQALSELGIGKTRLHGLKADFLRGKGKGSVRNLDPGIVRRESHAGVAGGGAVVPA